ncbi:hypothetical protein F5B22DRAFT_650453 [Xylaria bambusicola]|uniref:uncharacterized protein n=1 Tax=Xylaria bambusicola TaxID=326684 RepID=UPI002007B125|nr:uncharacterized protein F5B22DRAFT_650453 [Xylaria bambusicola]KAI0506805.1 hypothetical protein F5B22DRAFT_650453 [Xylaria bambusicola]
MLSDNCAYTLREQYSIVNPTAQLVEDLAFFFLHEAFVRCTGGTRTWPLPLPQRDWAHLQTGTVNRLVREQRAVHVDALAEHAQAVTDATGGLFFLDGPGGTGKTFVQNAILAHCRA